MMRAIELLLRTAWRGSFERHRIGLEHRLVHRLAREFARLVEPARRRRQAPELRAPRVRQVPAQRRVVDVDRLVVRVEQFDAMAVGIAEVDEERVADAVRPGPRSKCWPKPSEPATSQTCTMSRTSGTP